MATSLSNAEFVVWVDHTPYGPVELPTLVSWIRDDRIDADTWIFVGRNSAWVKASELPELQMFFGGERQAARANRAAPAAGAPLDFRALRRIRILATMKDDELERFAQFLETERFAQWSVVVRQGDPGDTMYFILEGELRVRIDLAGKETILATLGPGEFFGDISLFDHGPRSADVVANSDSVVMKFSTSAFDKLSKEAPELATPFLRAIGRTLTARIRADNKRYGDSVRFARAAS
jgi:hypothetical protein